MNSSISILTGLKMRMRYYTRSEFQLICVARILTTSLVEIDISETVLKALEDI